MYDVLIQNGTLVDGTGAPCRKGDIAIKDGKIAAVGENLPGEAARVIDAAGKVVSPGFIDFHNHSDAGILLGLDAHNYLEQGVTTRSPASAAPAQLPVTPAWWMKTRWDSPKRSARNGTPSATASLPFWIMSPRWSWGPTWPFSSRRATSGAG